MRCNILWIDDQHEDQTAFKTLALSQGLKLFPFKVSKEGMAYYENNSSKFDGIILDAKVFDESEDEVPETDGLMKSVFRLKEIQHKRYIPFFVFTGQADLLTNDQFAKMLPDVKIFKKGIDNEKLFLEIKRRVEESPNTAIRIDNRELFSVFDNGYLDHEVEGQVLSIFSRSIPNDRSQLKAVLVDIRSVHESCLIKLEELSVIPDSQASFNQIMKHLSGNKIKGSNNLYVATTKEYQNDAIENLNKWIYYTCGKYIHNLKNENYNGYIISNYAVESLKQGLYEVLIWLKKVIEEN
jgi:hypothetical protein